MSVSDGFVGFDAALAYDAGFQAPGVALSGDLAVASQGAPSVAGDRTAVEIGLAHGAPLDVMTEFLAALGLDTDADPGLLLDFDAEDLTAARRGFLVGVWRPHRSTRQPSRHG